MGSSNVIMDFVSTSTAKKIFQISHSQNLRKSVTGDQNVHMDSIFEKNYHKLTGVSHGANSKCAGKFRSWRVEKFAKRANSTVLG